MAEYKLGRLRFVWKSDWATGTTYYKDDVVKYGGKVFICIAGHTAAADFYTDLDAVPSKWNQLSDGFQWENDWAVGTTYKVNDLVKYGARLYVCRITHTSAATTALGLEADLNLADSTLSKWDIMADGVDWKGDWAVSTRYKVNDLVKYGGITYVCNTYHTSTASASSGLENDQAKWDEFNEGLEYKGAWATTTRYKLNDVIKYGSNLFICITQHTSTTDFITDSGNWSAFVEGLSFEDTWSNTTVYQSGDIVRYGGNQYVAITNHSGTTPTTPANSDWSLFSKGFSFISDWSSSTAYKVGEVVRLNGYTYLAIADGTNHEPPNLTYWERLNSGTKWMGEWQNSTAYKLGDVVRYGANAYICVQGHTSNDDDSTTLADSSRSPSGDTEGVYWNIFNIGNEYDIMSEKGDMVYYGGVSGPVRLPIGKEGMVLKVSSSNTPEWDYLGVVDYNFYVGTHGVDEPAPTYGRTIDKPWKTIRYACEQIDKGPRNPNAQRLLELNRAYIQREVSEWIAYQVTNNIAPFTSSFDFDEYKCERDIGFLVDRLIWDLGHGGNLKMRAAALAYVNALGQDGEFSVEGEDVAYSRLAVEADEDVAAYVYMKTVLAAVLNNTAPAVNYQALVGDNSTAQVTQFIDPDLEVETGVITKVNELVGIVITALTDQAATNVPERDVPNYLINVKTGTYQETLPIIVPAETAVLGDEVRSVTAGPAGSLISKDDAKYSIGALQRLETVVGQVVVGTNVTESTGNIASQDIAFPYASSVEAASLQQLVRMMGHRIDFSIGTTTLISNTDPTGYNSSYLSGYGDARKLLSENKDFMKEEIIAFIGVNYPTIKYSRTACRRDVGYIVDAMIYDLTYGGSTQSLNAGLAYFDGPGSTLMIDSTESAATIASYARLKTVMQSLVINSVITRSTGNTATQWTDSTNLTGGSAASSFIGANMDIISAILAGGSTTYRPSLTVTSITGTNTLNTTAAHGLAAGDLIVPRTTAYGLTADVRYYVISSGLTATAFQVSTSYAGSAVGSLTNGSGLTYIVDTEDRPIATNAVTTTTALITAYTTLSAAVSTIVTNMTSYITANYPSITYNSAKCQRDARIILDAVGYDFMFNANQQTVKAAYAYLRSSANDVFDDGTKAATRAAFSYVKSQAKSNVGGDSTAQSRIETLMTTLDDIIFGARDEGSVCQTEIRAADYARLQLERNRDYIVAEIDAYIGSTYKTTVTAATAATDLFTCADTSWMQRNAAIRFTGTTFGGVSTDTTYYIQNVVSSTTFKISTTRNSNTALDVASNATGSMTAALYYNSDLCLRDVNSYIDALKWDIQWTSNYKSRLAARYYANAVKGSYEEDMFYVRNGTGVRNMTLKDLTGDLTPPNAYGTSRVTAGAYVSLDPGWGPADFRTWTISRSCYVQNVTTFGYAAIGQKIDGALHNGGNKSIVSNDFTQVISDGIGAWVTNNARAELVSVFTYYSHIGYLSEAGGRIRGTNGNNSYGDFGSVAEGSDATETVKTAIVDNRYQFKSVVGRVTTDGSSIFRYEFDHAGNEYTEAVFQIIGPGNFADPEQDEFRDDGVYQVRLLDNVDDSSAAPEADGNIGGFGYLTSTGTAQTGTTTSVTLSATDDELSTAYVGMKIHITAGNGTGQFGLISGYNNGSKVASVITESTGAAGWDHQVPGTTIVAPDSSSSYLIEPAISFTGPTYSATARTLPTSGTWTTIDYGNTSAIYTSLTGTYSGSGSGATWEVKRNGSKYFLTNLTAGIGYTRLQTITILGTSLGGLTTTNDLTITITSVNSTTGAIQAWDFDGYGLGGRFVALRSGSIIGATSEDGATWTTRTSLMPSAAAWSATAFGSFDDGSSEENVTRFVAVAGSTPNTTGAYSADGITWTATSMGTSATWVDVAFGEGKFVAIASDSTTVRISLDGEVWDQTGTLPSTGFTAIAYGMGLFVAVRSGTTNAASSTDGVTWTSRTLPSSSAWNDVTWGNGRFVAISNTASSTVAAYSLDGTTWTASTLPATATWTKVGYGQGVFFAVSTTTQAASSEDGVNWTARTTGAAASGFSEIIFGNPQRSGIFAMVGAGTGTVAGSALCGAKTKARAYVESSKIIAIRITEPGSGYSSAPTITITDPNNLFEAPTTVRYGKGVLACPSFKNRGTGYVTANAELDTGNGYADFFQDGSYIAVRRISAVPAPGANLTIGALATTYKVVSVTTLRGSYDGSYTAFLQVSPVIKVSDNIAHGTATSSIIRYSQVRLTGHDFLDIGTGNFEETNYPGGEPENTPTQANETVNSNGGRVFYTSTDQDGNFRVGELFTIEQSTGVATLNADAFNISGLQELSLGDLTLGGGSATITEFSTDPFFTADSDSVIPTQRAIKAYIASQIGGGGASLIVNSVTAGDILIATNTISNVTGGSIKMNATMNYTGGIDGYPLAWNYFLT